MPRYENGRAPLSDLVKLADQHYLPVGTCARWRELQRLAWEKYGVWLVITPGWNGYRPLDVQIQYRKELGIWAAVPGYSSHGLTYQGRDCAAIDVNNWGALAPGNEALAWARFVALCRIVGLTVDFVAPREPWHIGDFDPFTVPAFASIVINPDTTNRPTPSEEDDMPINFRNGATGITYTMVPGHSIRAHDNGFGDRLMNYINTGRWPATEDLKDRFNAGVRDLNRDHVAWMLPFYGFGRLTPETLPQPGTTVYADKLVEQDAKLKAITDSITPGEAGVKFDGQLWSHIAQSGHQG